MPHNLTREIIPINKQTNGSFADKNYFKLSSLNSFATLNLYGEVFVQLYIFNGKGSWFVMFETVTNISRHCSEPETRTTAPAPNPAEVMRQSSGCGSRVKDWLWPYRSQIKILRWSPELMMIASKILQSSSFPLGLTKWVEYFCNESLPKFNYIIVMDPVKL